MLLNNDLKLNLFGLETQYDFYMIVYICLEKVIYAYFDGVKKTINSRSGNLGCSFKGIYFCSLQGIFH